MKGDPGIHLCSAAAFLLYLDHNADEEEEGESFVGGSPENFIGLAQDTSYPPGICPPLSLDPR